MNAITVKLPRDIAKDQDITNLVNDWRAQLSLQVQSGELADNTRSTYERGWGKFYAWLLAQEVDTVTSDTVRSWMSDLRAAGRKPTAINAWLSGVRAFFAWAHGARRLAVNPCEGVRSARRKGSARMHNRDILSDTEVRRTLDIPDRSTPAGKRDYALLVLKAFCALRDVELHRANLADLRTKDGKLVLYVQGKGQESPDDFVVLVPDVESAVYDWLAVRGQAPGPLFVVLGNRAKGDRLSLRSIRGIVKVAYKSAGVVGVGKTSHSLRHTAITSAIRHGAPVQKVQSMARHASLDTTMIYYHEADRLTDPAEEYIKYDARARVSLAEDAPVPG